MGQKAKWNLTGVILTVTFPDFTSGTFDLSRVFTDFAKLTDTQRNTVGYGVKQKLSDSTARSKDETLSPKDAVTVMTQTFDGIVDGTAWSKKSGGFTSITATTKAVEDPSKIASLADLVDSGILPQTAITSAQREILRLYKEGLKAKAKAKK